MSLSYLRLSSGGVYSSKNLLVLEQILTCKSKCHFGRAMSAKKANRKSRNLFPLEKWKLIMEVNPNTLMMNGYTFRMESLLRRGVKMKMPK